MSNSISPDLTLGPVSLTVADLERSATYYQHRIGLTLQQQSNGVAILGAGEKPLLKLREQPGARPEQPATGLYHFALRTPTRLELARTLRHLIETQTPIDGASDHLVSEALYLTDPDGHGLEIYRDRPRATWYDQAGRFWMTTRRLDVDSLLAEGQEDAQAWEGLHPAVDMGHVHLQVADVAAAQRFYIEVIGFELMLTMPQAAFVSAGGYHHHLGLNSWAGAGMPPPSPDAARLLAYEIRFPDEEALRPTLDRLRRAAVAIEEQEEGWSVRDPSQNKILMRLA